MQTAILFMGCPRLAKPRPCLTNRSLSLHAFFMIESDDLPDRGFL